MDLNSVLTFLFMPLTKGLKLLARGLDRNRSH
uniref:Uncharacterized protein n=1 Tax=Rhizophora mucronata TaxID=61149 RepID=A0A2P2QGX4_RHIMU